MSENECTLAEIYTMYVNRSIAVVVVVVPVQCVGIGYHVMSVVRRKEREDVKT
jgi:hypothetical protein